METDDTEYATAATLSQLRKPTAFFSDSLFAVKSTTIEKGHMLPLKEVKNRHFI